MRIRAKEIRRARHRREVRQHEASKAAGTATPTPARAAAPAPRNAAPSRPPRERKPKAEE